MNKSETIKELAISLAKFQSEVTNPGNSKIVSTGSFSYKYAPLDEVLKLVRPLLSKHNLSIVQAPTSSENYISVSTILLHGSGEWLEFEPITLKMDKVTAQGAGSAITYARRYALSSILGISSEDDDDANSIEPKQSVKPNNQTNTPGAGSLSEKQIARLFAKAHGANIDADTVKDQVKRKYNKEVSELTKEEYEAACTGYDSLKK